MRSYSTFFLKEHPSVSLALPPVGWQRTAAQVPHTTTDWECEKTVSDVEAPPALDVHEEGVWALNQALELVLVLHDRRGGFSKSISEWSTMLLLRVVARCGTGEKRKEKTEGKK